MPFIDPDKRKVIDPVIDVAWADIHGAYLNHGWSLDKAGNLAYIVYRLMLLAVETAGKRGWGSLTRVWSDVALGAATYFRKEEIDRYEADKLEENGPVILQCLEFDDDIPF